MKSTQTYSEYKVDGNPETYISNQLRMMNDILTLQETLDRVNIENHDLKDKILRLGVDYDYTKNRILELNDQVSSFKNKEYKELKEQLELKTDALVSALNKLDDANATISKLESYIQTEQWKQDRSLQTAESESKRLENNSKHAQSIIDDLTKTLKFANAKLEEVKTNENHLARKTIDLYNENKKLSSKIDELTKQIESSKKDNITPVTPDTKELDKYRNFYTNIGHVIFHIISCNPIKKPVKIYRLYKDLSDYFKKSN